jgi:hypothetical protein
MCTALHIAHGEFGRVMAEPAALATYQQLVGDLMIAVIERFTPRRPPPPRLQDVDRGTGRLDWRIRHGAAGRVRSAHRA